MPHSDPNIPNDAKKYILIKDYPFPPLKTGTIIYIERCKQDLGNHSRFVIFNDKGRNIINTIGFRDQIGVYFVDYRAILREQKINEIFDIE